MYIWKGSQLHGCVRITNNIVVQHMTEQDLSKPVVIIGNGHSLSCDSDGCVTYIEPLCRYPDISAISDDYDIYAFYFTEECAGLDASANELANWIDSNADFTARRVILVGHSKCGLCVFQTRMLLKKVRADIITISTPFKGTYLVDGDMFLKRPKKFGCFFNPIYKAFFSNHNVDKDLAIGSDYIKHIKRLLNIGGNGGYHHLNITTKITSMYHVKSIQDYVCYALNWSLGMKGDGIVEYSSQCLPHVRELCLDAPHHNSLKLALKLHCLNELYFDDKPYSM